MAVALGLVVALSYGAADFLGGYASQRASTTSVTVVTQFVALGLALTAVLVAGWDEVRGVDAGLGALAGLSQLAAVNALYRGLATGRMSVVAPVSAVTSALVPVTWGLARGEEPGAIALAGVALAIVAVAVVARAPDASGASGLAAAAPLALALALLAGVGFGVSFICFGETAKASGLWPVAIARLVAGPALVAGLLATRRALLPPPEVRRIAVATGVLDMTANVVLLLAVRQGLMSLVAPVASLYPGGTVVLARAVLGEPIGRTRVAGLGLALVALLLIAW
jgi:drug/metabolite transporter (DMT)-like permease